MRVNRITLKGITRYTDEVSLDLAERGPGLIALAGTNGAGKTTMLEAAFAGLHREYPTRPGPLHHVCHGKDARIELNLQNGAGELRSVVAVDAVLKTPKTEAFLFDGDGSPITDGKTSTFDEAILERFGSSKLMLSAALSCQNRRGEFLSLSKADRKDLLCEILDVGGLQDIATAAREQAKALESEIVTAKARVEAAMEELDRLKHEDADVEGFTKTKAALETTLAEDRQRLEDLREKHGGLSAAVKNLDGIKAELLDLQKRSAAARSELDRIPGLIEDAGHGLKDAEYRYQTAVEAAETDAANLAEYEAAEKELEELRKAEEALHTRRDEAEEELRRVLDAAREAEARRSEVRRLKEQLEAATKATDVLPTVPCHGAGDFSSCKFLTDAKASEATIPDLIRQLAELEDADDGLEPLAEHNAQVAVNETVEAIRAHRVKLDETAALAAKAEPARMTGKRVTELREILDGAKEQHSKRLAEIEERRTALEAERDKAEADSDALDLKLSESTALRDELEEVKDQGIQLKRSVEAQERKLSDLTRQIAAAEQIAQRREDLEKTLTEQSGKSRLLGDAVADWRLLERAFGRDGIQALEIDAAGPDLSRLTNDLLTACFGERFNVSFVTQVPKASGGMKEVFDVEVLDHERGREGSVDSLSGGEKTVISEAISLALAIYVAKHSGRRFESLFRDETAGALDPDNADRYVRMLRKARELSGAFQVIFIAQQPEVYEQADAVVWLEDGRAEVRE